MNTKNIVLQVRCEGKWKWKEVLICTLVLLVIMIASTSIAHLQSADQIHVYYSLDARHNDKELIRVIDDADKYVYFAIYYFTKSSIADALIRAKKRGVEVVGIMDRESSLNSNARILERLQAANVRILTQKHPDGIMHIKALVTESAYASGSYNWTDGATNVNDEVLEIGRDVGVREQYLGIIKGLLITNN